MSLPQSSPVFIYGLCDPRTGELRYVGKTVNIEERMNKHIYQSRHKPTRYCQTWIKSLLNDSVRPAQFIIEEATIETWREVERFWIAYFRFVGCDLTNLVDGGYGSDGLSQEIRERISAKLKGRKMSPECVEKHKQWLRENGHPMQGRKQSPESIERSRQKKLGHPTWIKGKKHTPETRAKIRGTLAKAVAEGRMSFNTGRKHSTETKEKLREINSGKVTFILRHRDGTELTVSNLIDFCRKNGLKRETFQYILSGRKKTCHGWTIERVGDIPCTNAQRRPPNSKDYIVTSPMGEESHIQSLTQFCEENGLNPNCMKRVYQGHMKQHQGWKIRQVESKPVSYIATSPNGTECQTSNLNQFSKENGLNSATMYGVVKGLHKTHKGWCVRKSSD